MHKYGADYLERATLKDGTDIEIRLVRPADKHLLVDGLQRMSPASRFFRFFAHRDHLTLHELAYLTELDQESHLAIGARTFEPDGTEVGLGVARFVRLEPPEIAEAAIAVIDDAQGKGLGKLLFKRLVEAAHERGVMAFRFDILAENDAMLTLVHSMFPETTGKTKDGVVTVDCPLPSVDAVGTTDDSAALYRLLRHAAEGALRVYRRLRDGGSLGP